MSGRYDVIIVGGGMVGTTLAVALSRAGFHVALVESAAPPAFDADDDYDLRVSAISAASQRLFERLGIWPAIAAGRISPYREMHVWDAMGGGALHFSSAELGVPELGHIIENKLVQHAAWQALRDVELCCPASVGVLVDGEREATVGLADGRSLSASLVIGADGANSKIRQLAHIGTSGWPYDQRAIVCVVETGHPHQCTAWQRFLPTGPLAFLPLADGRCSIVWSVTNDEAAKLLALDSTAFASRLDEASESALGKVTAFGPRAAFPLRLQHAETYVRPRVALVGDAAHVIHPLAGQGVNLGLLDVAALTEVLVSARRDGRDIGNARVLGRYERWRRADNLMMMATMDGLKRLFGARNPVLRFARSRGLGFVNALAPVKNLLIRHAMGLEGDLPPLVRVV